MLASALSILAPTISIAQMESLPAANDQVLYIIRHGESTSNVPDPDTGIHLTSGKSLGIELTPKGKDQALRLGQALASRIKEGSEVVICSSTAVRAQQTAQEIFNILRLKNQCELDTSYDGLCELGQGKWEGLPKDEAYTQELKLWEEKSASQKVIHPKVTSGESHEEVAARYLPDLQKIVQKHSGKIILVVSHYSAINAMALRVNQVQLSQTPRSKLPMIALENCDMVAMQFASKDLSDARVIGHISCDLE